MREVSAAVSTLHERGVTIRALREGVDTSTSAGRMLTSVMAAVAELELELGKERRAASRARASHVDCPRRDLGVSTQPPSRGWCVFTSPVNRSANSSRCLVSRAQP